MYRDIIATVPTTMKKCCFRSLSILMYFTCQLLRLNFKNKSDFFNYVFSFKLSAIPGYCSGGLVRELDRERK